MVVKKKVVRKGTDNLDNLYISMHNPKDKRKDILNSIKNSLVMQDEYEKVIGVRKEKHILLNEIKKEMSSLNSNYQKLKKLLPNIKGVLSYTEKELNELNQTVNVLRSDIKSDNEKIAVTEGLEYSIANGELNKNNKQNTNNINDKEKINSKQKTNTNPKKKELKKKVIPVKLSKLDRIKNNLKVVESKLNSM